MLDPDALLLCALHPPTLRPRPLMQVTLELKNDLAITGTLHSVDQYLNVKLTNTRVENETKYPHMVGARGRVSMPCLPVCCVWVCRRHTCSTCQHPPPKKTRPAHTALPPLLQMSVRNCFVRGSVVRCVLVSSKQTAAAEGGRKGGGRHGTAQQR